MEREGVPFPLLSGMYIRNVEEGKSVFYKISGQAQFTILSAPYLIPPSTSQTGQLFTIGNVNAFQTNDKLFKQWVSWIDNKYLGVQWVIGGTTLPQLNGVPQYLTIQDSPEYEYSVQYYSVNEPTATTSYNLINLSSQVPIRGVFKVLIATYSVSEISQIPAGSSYTDITIGGIGAPNPR
ncbi:MAG: hypothetical protein QW203_07350 [Thermoplasmatales archaeon]